MFVFQLLAMTTRGGWRLCQKKKKSEGNNKQQQIGVTDSISAPEILSASSGSRMVAWQRFNQAGRQEGKAVRV